MNVVGPNVQRIRQAKGLTQSELVARCNLVELDISRSTLAKIESKVRRVTDLEVWQLSQALSVPVDQLFQSVSK